MRAHEPRPSCTRRHHHPKGMTKFHLRSKFLSYSRAGLAGEAADEQLFARRNSHAPQWACRPDISLLRSHSPSSKNVH